MNLIKEIYNIKCEYDKETNTISVDKLNTSDIPLNYNEVRLYNSLTNQVELFKPIKENEVSCYVCGPTVYNYVHIGNMRPVVTFDILRRLFIRLGYKVTFISKSL